jgi:hypothetical protein
MSQYLGMANLTEIYVSNNCLPSLEGLDSLGVAIEVLDLSKNKLEVSSSMSVVSSLAPLKNLQDIRLGNNPGLGLDSDQKAAYNLMECIRNSCPSVLSMDGRIIREAIPVDSVEDSAGDAITVPDDLMPVSSQHVTKQQAKPGSAADSDEDASDDDQLDHNVGRPIPTLALKELLTEQQISAKEKEITDLLVHSKETLQLASTVFAFDGDSGETRNDAAVEVLTAALATKLKEGFKLVNDIKDNKRKAIARVEARNLRERERVRKSLLVGDGVSTTAAERETLPVINDMLPEGSVDVDDVDDASSVGMTFLSSTKNVNVLVAQNQGSRPSTSNAGNRPASAKVAQPAQSSVSRPISALDVLLSGSNSQRRKDSATIPDVIDHSNENKESVGVSGQLSVVLQQSFKPTSTTVEATAKTASTADAMIVQQQQQELLEMRRKRFQTLAASGLAGLSAIDRRNFVTPRGAESSRPVSATLAAPIGGQTPVDDNSSARSPRMLLEHVKSMARSSSEGLTIDVVGLLSGVKSLPVLDGVGDSTPDATYTHRPGSASSVIHSENASPRENLR